MGKQGKKESCFGSSLFREKRERRKERNRISVVLNVFALERGGKKEK